MSVSTFTIRLDEKTKELFNELAKQNEFENKGDFLKRLLLLYQAEKTKENVSMLKPAIETVELLTSRLLEVLIGAGVIITTNEEKHQRELNEQCTTYEGTHKLLKQRIAVLEQEQVENEKCIQSFKSDKETAERKNYELQQEIKELKSTISDKIKIEQDKELLDLKQQLQSKAEEQLSKHTATINEYESKVKDLLNLLEQREKPASTTSRARKTTKKTPTASQNETETKS